jgi:ABC-type sugar transport system permease subunit
VTALVPAAVAWQFIFNYQAGILNFALKSLGTAMARFLSFAAGGIAAYLWIGLAVLWLGFLLWTARRRSPIVTVVLGLIAAGLLALGLLFRLQPSALAAVNKQLIEFFPVKWLQEPRGLLLYVGQRWGIQVPPWAQGPSMALIAVSIVSIWHLMGYDVVIYLAGLGNVPSELYEAARIDGASESQLFWRITFPMLSPTTYFLTIVSTIGAFRAFTLFYIMTGGGPLRTTTSVSYFVFDRFWNAQRAGYASAAAFVLFGMILLLTLIQQRIIGRNVTYQ